VFARVRVPTLNYQLRHELERVHAYFASSFDGLESGHENGGLETWVWAP